MLLLTTPCSDDWFDLESDMNQDDTENIAGEYWAIPDLQITVPPNTHVAVGTWAGNQGSGGGRSRKVQRADPNIPTPGTQDPVDAYNEWCTEENGVQSVSPLSVFHYSCSDSLSLSFSLRSLLPIGARLSSAAAGVDPVFAGQYLYMALSRVLSD